jgi:hypothetical protein
MTKERVHQAVVIFVVFLFAASAIGYLFFPSAMLNVVGIRSTAQMEFLVRTLAAAFVAMIPSAWNARKKRNRNSLSKRNLWTCHLYVPELGCGLARFLKRYREWCIHTQYYSAPANRRFTLVAYASTINYAELVDCRSMLQGSILMTN